MTQKKFNWVIGGVALGALTVGTLALLNRRIHRWENLSCEDAEDGEWITLADGNRMHYTLHGDPGSQREPLILIHGFLGSSYEWFRNAHVFARERPVWAIDLIGFGYSERVDARTYSLKAYARQVREFMDAQGIARATLVGHSMGGAIALEFAHAYPECVSKLILVAPAAWLAHVPAPINYAARAPIVPRALIGWMVSTPYARVLSWQAALGQSPQGVTEIERSLRALRVRGTTDAIVALVSSERNTDLETGIERIATPTLIVSGDRDLVVPNWHCRDLARRLPNARLVTLNGGGHVPHIQFADAVNQLVRDFLEK